MRYLALALLSCIPIIGYGEDLTDIYHLAVDNDPTLKAQEAAYKANQEAIPQAVASLLPRLSAQYTTNGIDSGAVVTGDKYNSKNYGLSLSQPVYRPDLWSRLEQARHTEKQGLATYLASAQDLIIRVAERYFAVLSAKDDVFFSKAQRKAFARQLEQTQQRFDVGLIAITDVHEAQARLDDAIATEIRAENNLADQYERLREITGQPILDVAILDVTDQALLQTPMPNDQEQWVDTAQQSNLDIIAAKEASQVARSEIANQATGHYPRVDVTANLQKNKGAPAFVPNPITGTNDQLPGLRTTQRNVSLNLSVPIFEGGGVTFRVKEAQARFEEALYRLDVTRRATYSQTRQKYRGVLTQISQVKSLAQAVVSNQSALKATQAAYEVGTRTVVDVLDAESNLLRAQRDYAQSRYNYVLEGLRLKRAAGTLKSEDVYEVNSLLADM